MRSFRFTFLALFFVSNLSWAMAVNSTHSGAWYNYNQPGHGLSVEVMDSNRAILFWYVYDPNGKPIFLYIDGFINGDTISGTAYHFEGMRFGDFDHNVNVRTAWGQVSMTFLGCQDATFSYTSSTPGYSSGSMAMTRLIAIPGIKCTDAPMHNNYHMTLVSDQGDIGIGTLWVFEDGYTSFVYYSGLSGKTGFGWSTLSGNNRWEFSFTAFELGGTSGEQEFASGQLNGTTLTGTYDDGVIIATAIETFQETLTYTDVSKTYDLRDILAPFGEVTLHPDGSLTGSTQSGCVLSGTYLIPDQQVNQMYVDIDIANCAEGPSAYGVGNRVEDGVIGLAMSDGSQGFVWYLEP